MNSLLGIFLLILGSLVEGGGVLCIALPQLRFTVPRIGELAVKLDGAAGGVTCGVVTAKGAYT